MGPPQGQMRPGQRMPGGPPGMGPGGPPQQGPPRMHGSPMGPGPGHHPMQHPNQGPPPPGYGQQGPWNGPRPNGPPGPPRGPPGSGPPQQGPPGPPGQGRPPGMVNLFFPNNFRITEMLNCDISSTLPMDHLDPQVKICPVDLPGILEDHQIPEELPHALIGADHQVR